MTDERIELGFADLLDLLSAVFDVPPAGRQALTSRLKHLQTKRFPAGVNTKKVRARYDVTAIMGIATVLALSAAFVPPDVAVAIARDNWEELRKTIGNVAIRSPTLRDVAGAGAGADEVGTLVLIETNALSDLGTAAPSEGRAAGMRGARKLTTLKPTGVETFTPSLPGGTAILLNVGHLVAKIADELVAKRSMDGVALLYDLVGLGPIATWPSE